MRPHIYIIRGPTQSVYVGQTSTSSATRWRKHKTELRGGRHTPYLQNAWNKYGEDAFRYDVIEYCDAENLTAREQHWMDTLRPLGLYNTHPAVNSVRGRTPKKEHIEKIRAIKTGMTYRRSGVPYNFSDAERERRSLMASLRNYDKPSPNRKQIVLSNGRVFNSHSEFAEACGYATTAAIPRQLERGDTYETIAARRGIC